MKQLQRIGVLIGIALAAPLGSAGAQSVAGLSATPVTNQYTASPTVRLSWSAGSGVAFFSIQRMSYISYPNVDRACNLGGSARSDLDVNCQPGWRYYYKITSYNSGSKPVSSQTTSAVAPTGLVLSFTSNPPPFGTLSQPWTFTGHTSPYGPIAFMKNLGPDAIQVTISVGSPWSVYVPYGGMTQNPLTLPPGAAVSLALNFGPTAPGTYQSTLRITGQSSTGTTAGRTFSETLTGCTRR
jgi:hypothetical protein